MSGTSTSSFSNELHQLLVSVSKHFYVTKSGRIKYQEKPFQVNINTYKKTGKEHLVYYILQDHFSGNFVFEITTTNSLFPLADFLFHVWKKKEGHFLWGMPERIYIPKMISSLELFAGLENIGVQPLNPPSGFAAGVRIIRDIEANVAVYMGRLAVRTVDTFRKNLHYPYHYMLGLRLEGNKYQRWLEHLPPGHPKMVPDYPFFIKQFASPSFQPGQGLPLVSSEQHNVTIKPPSFEFETGIELPIKNKEFSPQKLEEAQDIIYQAWEEEDRERCLDLAFKALDKSPYCADAYVLLATQSDYTAEKIDLLRRGVQIGKLVLGDAFFDANKGHFWLLTESRPYMRALYNLAAVLDKVGEKQQAINYYQQLLQLNPNDNQGIRYNLAFCLLAEDRLQELAKLLDTYQEGTCFFAYTKALMYYRIHGPKKKAHQHLLLALASNQHVPAYLLGSKYLPYQEPAYYSLGSEDEAVIYAKQNITAWENTPGALEWLAELVEESG